jgi:hypothetical protein
VQKKKQAAGIEENALVKMILYEMLRFRFFILAPPIAQTEVGLW